MHQSGVKIITGKVIKIRRVKYQGAYFEYLISSKLLGEKQMEFFCTGIKILFDKIIK